MKREQYLMLRKKGDVMSLLYVYALEANPTVKLDNFTTFKMKFMSWMVSAEQKQELYNRIRDLYDKKFTICITKYNDKILNIQ